MPLGDEHGVNIDITSFRSPADIGSTLVRVHAQLIISSDVALVYKLMCNIIVIIGFDPSPNIPMYSCDSRSTQRFKMMVTMLLCDDFVMQESDSRIFVVITSPVLARAVLCKVSISVRTYKLTYLLRLQDNTTQAHSCVQKHSNPGTQLCTKRIVRNKTIN